MYPRRNKNSGVLVLCLDTRRMTPILRTKRLTAAVLAILAVTLVFAGTNEVPMVYPAGIAECEPSEPIHVILRTADWNAVESRFTINSVREDGPITYASIVRR